MTDKPKYIKNEYDKQYKEDHFDHFSFYAPKGIKEQVQTIAKSKGIKMTEYIRNALIDAIEKDTQ